MTVQVVLLLLRSGYQLRSYATFLLFLGCSECICRSAHQRNCSGTRKNWSMIEKCVTLLTHWHGSMWIKNIAGLQRKVIILGWVLLLMDSIPLGCKMLHTPYGMLS